MVATSLSRSVFSWITLRSWYVLSCIITLACMFPPRRLKTKEEWPRQSWLQLCIWSSFAILLFMLCLLSQSSLVMIINYGKWSALARTGERRSNLVFINGAEDDVDEEVKLKIGRQNVNRLTYTHTHTRTAFGPRESESRENAEPEGGPHFDFNLKLIIIMSLSDLATLIIHCLSLWRAGN